MPTLHIELLSDFSLRYDDQQVTGLNTTRLQSLLAYLVLHRGIPQQRQHLAFLFWPDATEPAARNNLRQLIHQLRQVFPGIEHFLHIDASTLHWRIDSQFKLDVAEFELALGLIDETAQWDARPSLQTALERAHMLYRGELLPSCYDEWIIPERERLRQHHIRILEQLQQLHETQGSNSTAIQYAQHLLRCNPLSEDLYRRLMRLFALNNDRASAIHTYHTCVSILKRELGVKPDPATREVYEQLLQTEAPTTQPPRHWRSLSATPTLIGRKAEWATLQMILQRAKAREPGFVLVSGEAGIGKSRLAEDFLLWAERQGIATAKARSYASASPLSLAPLTDWLRSDCLRPHLERLDPVWLSEIARILPELLTARPDIPPSQPLTGYGQRQRFFEALAHALLEAAQPLVLLIDDLQWCDLEMLEFLHFLLRFSPTAQLFIIGCVRMEELSAAHPLRTLLLHLHNTIGVTEISLQPLNTTETTELATQVASHKLEPDALAHVYQEAEGYPLFIVEIVRAGVSKEVTHPHEIEYLRLPALFDNASSPLPPRMHAVLADRLLQLSPSSRTLVELAAIIGREFTLELLMTIGNSEIDTVVHALDELWRKRIVREHGTDSYDFTHDKLREVAYLEISAPQRRMLHLRTAQALETIYTEDLDPVRGQIASHYERAGLMQQAISYYVSAAVVAQRLYANEDAIHLLSHSLKLLELQPAGSKRDRQELCIQLTLAPLYRIMKGWAASELEVVLERALALCDTVGNNTQRVQALYGLQSLYLVQAKLEKVGLVSDELHTLYADSLGTQPPRFIDTTLTSAQLFLGKITEANEQFASQITETNDFAQIVHLQESQGANFAALERGVLAHSLWLLGYPQQALKRGLEATWLVYNQPFNQVLAATYMASLQQLLTDAISARMYAEEALTLASKYQAHYYRAWAAILVHYSRALNKPDNDHIMLLRDAIEQFKASSARLRMPYYLWLLAHIYGKAGLAKQGLLVINDALTEARAHHEYWWNAELHRLRGELLILQGADVADSEAALLRAIDVARRQRAKSLELRATISLTNLWDTQKRSEEARERLSAIYDWFTEGFDTPDLQAARHLLSRRKQSSRPK